MIKDILAQIGYSTGLYIPYSKHKTRRFRHEIKEKNLQYITEFDWSDYKTSDRLFILGSGYSINKLTKQNWAKVRESDSIGLNKWVFHDFVPTYYVLETPVRTEHFQFVKKEINNKANLYKNVPFFIHYPHLSKSNNHYKDIKIHRSNIFYNAPYMPNTLNIKIIRRMLANWNKKKIKSMEDLIHYSGSLSYIIMMGVIMGYQEIVLLGVDLNDNRYFFHSKDASESARMFLKYHDKNLKLTRNTTVNAGHVLSDKKLTNSFGCVPLPEYMKYLKEGIEKEGVSLKIGNKESKLFPLLDAFEF